MHVLCIVDCPFPVAIVLFVVLRYMDSDYIFGIFIPCQKNVKPNKDSKF